MWKDQIKDLEVPNLEAFDAVAVVVQYASIQHARLPEAAVQWLLRPRPETDRFRQLTIVLDGCNAFDFAKNSIQVDKLRHSVIEALRVNHGQQMSPEHIERINECPVASSLAVSIHHGRELINYGASDDALPLPQMTYASQSAGLSECQRKVVAE